MVGPRSLGVCLLTAAFVGMVFTIQFIRWVGGWEGGWCLPDCCD
jgi:ABC-type transporter Mla maintaining outer membrane lipid asymmetry permease subunit MlaE